MDERWLPLPVGDETPTGQNTGRPGVMAAVAVVLLAALLLSGCVYKGAKVTEGTDLSVGLSIPGTEGAASVTILNYLSGFRLGLAQNAQMTLAYTVSETNSYLGIATTRTQKTITATVTPTENEQEAHQ